MQHHPFTPTDFQRANLERLAAHLDLGVTNLAFDMLTFSDTDYPHECGTVGCAAGHGPSLGIEALEGESWAYYSRRVFTDNSDAFNWMFSAQWTVSDNSPRGAAARIRYALKQGIPANCYRQCSGYAPLSYTVPDRAEPPVVVTHVTA